MLASESSSDRGRKELYMKETAGGSADIKMALKHDPATKELRSEIDTLECDEAVNEVEQGWDTCHSQSVVAELLKEGQ